MSIDYGLRRRPRDRLPMPAIVAGVALTALIGGAVEIHLAMLKTAANAAAASEWEVEGPPCPRFTAQQFARQGLSAPKVFGYDDLVIGRAVGHVSCGAAGDDHGRARSTHPVCEFTGPAALRVKTPKGEFFFAPGVGRPATVSVEHGVSRCVLASHFTIGD